MRVGYFWRTALPTLILVSAFVLLYEATVSDSRFAARQAELLEGTTLPAPGSRLQFEATAYCKGTTTASGVAARTGIAAADPKLLPVGSVIQLETDEARYSGIYTVMDTGPLVQGRHVDLYIWSCYEALAFGRKLVHVMVLRLGWNPSASTPLIETLFHRRTPASPSPPQTPAAKPPAPGSGR
jgi:3D (Asp-Asp-Asp) domain-containing protein